MSSNCRQVFALATLAAASCVLGITSQAHAQEQLWIRQFGTTGNDEAFALAADGAGGVMVAGRTEGNLGGLNLTPGTTDVFLARYDNAGDQLWILQFGTDYQDEALALSPDGAGGVMVAGRTVGGLGGPRMGGWDAFLARYDGAGNQQWIRQFGSTSSDFVSALAPDGAGGVIVAGETTGNLGGRNAGLEDAFLARYTGAGRQLWIRQFGTSTRDEASAIAPDGAGGVMVAGFTRGSLTGEPFRGGFSDAFLASYDGAGNQRWIRQFGTSADDVVNALAPDGNAGVFVGGWMGGNPNGPFGGGTGDVFLARYDGAGNRLWMTKVGTSRSQGLRALAADGAGGVIIVGSASGSLRPILLGRYDGAGNLLWIRQFGTSTSDLAPALARDGTGGVMVAGWTAGNLGGRNSGENDAFIAQFTEEPCYADCDQSGVLDIFDFLCFQNSFVSAESYACDCDPDPVCDMADFLCFQNAFMGGCP
ncbi:MAG: hypothetical protein IID31_13110 [Planctomycetes bacterium]|nr:hypothetical protein [Planctomycetota bacterium]